MAAGFQWAQRNGAGGTTTILGTSGNLFNFKDIDTTGIGDYIANPIIAGNNSYEVWLRGHFLPPFNRVSDLKFWMSTDFSPNTGLSVFWTGEQVTYLQPASGTSSIATSSIPTASPGSPNVSIGGNLSGSLVASGYSDHIVLQLRTTAAAPPGDTSLASFSLSYLEN